MQAFRSLTVVLARLYLRDPLGALFSLALAPALVVLFGLAFGNDPDPALGGLGMLDANLPAIAAWVFAMMGLFVVPIAIMGRREAGTLRRFMATPLRPITYVAADVVVNLAMALLGVALLFAVGMVAFGARGEGPAAAVALAVAAAAVANALAFLALGYALASLLPTARSAQVLGNLLAIPMLFLSGATAPLQFMPPAVQQAARLNPLHHAVELLRGAWQGVPASELAASGAVIAGLLVVSVTVAAWRFRWE